MTSLWQQASRLCSVVTVVTKACLQSRQLLSNYAVRQSVTRACLDRSAQPTVLHQTRLCSSSSRQSSPMTACRINVPITRVLSQCHVSQVRWGSSSEKEPRDYTPPSPFRRPGPRRYGYESHVFTGGLLPRGNVRRSLPLPRHKDNNAWCNKKALFGQNDYIDILGDGNVRPSDLLKGPNWLLGFRGNELQRLTRRMRAEGEDIRRLYPTKHNQMKKRIKFLYKRINFGRFSKYR